MTRGLIWIDAAPCSSVFDLLAIIQSPSNRGTLGKRVCNHAYISSLDYITAPVLLYYRCCLISVMQSWYNHVIHIVGPPQKKKSTYRELCVGCLQWTMLVHFMLGERPCWIGLWMPVKLSNGNISTVSNMDFVWDLTGKGNRRDLNSSFTSMNVGTVLPSTRHSRRPNPCLYMLAFHGFFWPDHHQLDLNLQNGTCSYWYSLSSFLVIISDSKRCCLPVDLGVSISDSSSQSGKQQWVLEWRTVERERDLTVI